MNKKRLSKLLSEMEMLKEKGVISSGIFTDIQNYYEITETQPDTKARITLVFGILGGLLIGGGIILLLAHNWSSLNRIMQSALFIGPLLAVQVISAAFLLKDNVDRVWFETVGIIYYLLIGAAIAMISRIYHVGGDLETFLLVWAVGGLSVCYFLKSDAAAFLYIITAISWAAASQQSGGNAVLFWLLYAAVLPKLVLSFRKSGSNYHRIVIEFFIIASAAASIGITLEKVLPGLWTLVYSVFFILLFLSGDFFGTRLKISRGAGLLGISAMAVLLTISELWEDVGFREIRRANRFHASAAVFDYIILGVMIALILYLIFRGRVKPTPVKMLFSSVILPVAAGFLFPDYGAIILHLYIMILGFSLTIKTIITEERKMYADIGLLVIFVSMLLHLAVYDGFSYYWIFLYCCFLVVLFIKCGLFSGRYVSGTDKYWKILCTLTGLGLIYGLSFTGSMVPLFPDDDGFKIWYIFPLIVSGGAAVYHLIPYFAEGTKRAVLVAMFPVIALISLSAGTGSALFYNLYLLIIGIAVILNGIKFKSMKTANGGIIITLILIVTRFFDVDMSFSARGIVFIFLGIIFLVFNISFSRKFKKEQGQ
jgi:uncharacterized membrane protein